jgi:hypothetical protein
VRTFIEITAEQRSAAWFAARLGKLTASRAKDMLATVKSGEAAARRDLRVQLICERLTGQGQEDAYVSADMERGVTLEPEAVGAYEVATGNLVRSVGFLAHTSLMAGGSPDGVIGDYEGLIEIKCPRPANHLRWLRAGSLPKEHEAQVRHLLWLTGAAWLDFVSYCPVFPAHLQLFITRVELVFDAAVYDYAARAFLAEVDAEMQSLAPVGDQLRASVAQIEGVA